jgi:hypothetical protein
MNKNQEANTNKTVFEQQAIQLLNELSQIINEKWNTLNNTGCNYIKTMSNLFTDISSNGNEEENKYYDKKADSWTFNATNLTFINQCNETFEKLSDLLDKFRFYLNRLIKIYDNLISLNGSDLEVFNMLNFQSLKLDLAKLCECFKKEFSFKSVLIKKYLFESRFDDQLKIAILSSWMHQPYLDELRIFKINTILDDSKILNKNKF